jgi:hypothetical protein
MQDSGRVQEVDTSETGQSEPGSDGVARARMRHLGSMGHLSHERIHLPQKEEDKILPDPDIAFRDIQVPEDVCLEAAQTRAAGRGRQRAPGQDLPPSPSKSPGPLHFLHRAPSSSMIQSSQLTTMVFCALNKTKLEGMQPT